MRRALPWALCASVVVYACASNDPAETTSATEPPPSQITGGDASLPSAPEAGVETGIGTKPPPVTCGDGKVTAGEECDDGNNVGHDGCSATCKTESSGPEDVCPGKAIALTGAGSDTRKGTVTGSTSAAYSQYSGSCGGGTGKDAVYVVTPDVTGLLTAKVSGSFDALLYARRTCADTKTEAACNDAPGAKGGEQIKIAVTKNQPVYLFVDGYSGSAGNFTLDVEVATAFCGNGVAEPPEACDDGNTLAGDGCAADCSFEAGGVLKDCPGQGVTLSGAGNAPRSVSFAGTTAGLGSSTLTPAACSGGGPNAVYAVTPDVSGSLTAKLVATYDNATLHVRTECDISDTQLDCKEATEPLETLELTVPVTAGLPHYVVVDSSSSTYSGSYTVEVTVRPGACGNGILDGGEQCDDGNGANGDGCSSMCVLEAVSAAADTCPGATLALSAAAGGKYAGVVTASTTGLTSDYKPKTSQGSCSTSNSAKDAVYVVTSPIDGLLRATVAGTFDSMVYARTACDADAAAFVDLGCAGAVDGNGAETVTVPIEANVPLYLVVDGEVTAAAGTFQLAVEVTPSTCGNGALEGGEKCDDGNAAGGDGCSAACQLEPATKNDTCANASDIVLTPGAGGTYAATISSGTTNLTHDQTFTGCSSLGPDAIFEITAPIDGVLTAGVPVAGFNVSLGARTTCPSSTTASVPLVCANASSDDGQEEISFSVVQGQTYYLIVDGTASTQLGPFTMLVDVRPPGCGDGLISGGEQCDDGNTVNGDGCTSTCTVEALAGIDTCPGYVLPLSGAGEDPRTGVLTIDTSALTANYAGNCGGSSKEGVVVVTPPINGKLTAKLTGITYQTVLYARTTCNDAVSEKACDDDAPVPSTPARDITISGVTAGTPYYLFIDGYNGASGVARLNVTVTP